jgi:hypothetical protein
MLDFVTQIPQILHLSAHVANGSDAICEKERNDEFAAAAGFAGAS